MTDDTLKKIREAYAEACREQSSEYPPLPAWEMLPIQMREALIHVYHQGKIDARNER
jgi:hypothetical protein